MADRGAETALFDEFARAAKALASGRRIELVDVLANGERTVEALAGEVGLSVANTSQRLQVLRQAGLVASRREAPRSTTGWPGRRCSSSGGSCGLWPPAAWPRSSGSPPPTSAGATSWSQSPARSWPAGSRTATWWCWTCGPRPSAAGHLPGAVSIPVGAVAAGRAPRDREIVAYCRGPYCAFAEAVAMLRQEGFSAGWRTGCPNGRPPAWPSPA